jgi:hypothetical protein
MGKVVRVKSKPAIQFFKYEVFVESHVAQELSKFDPNFPRGLR